MRYAAIAFLMIVIVRPPIVVVNPYPAIRPSDPPRSNGGKTRQELNKESAKEQQEMRRRIEPGLGK